MMNSFRCFEKFTLHELAENIILECTDADRSIIISDPVGYYQPKLVFDGLKGNPRISTGLLATLVF